MPDLRKPSPFLVTTVPVQAVISGARSLMLLRSGVLRLRRPMWGLTLAPMKQKADGSYVFGDEFARRLTNGRF